MKKPMITDERLNFVYGEHQAMAAYRDLRQSGGFLDFAREFMHCDNPRVARNALWVLTKATDEELATLQVIYNELIDLAISTEHSAVRRLSLNIVIRLKMDVDDLRTDFLDFCLEHAVDVNELPGIQTLCMKLAFRMCSFYPELMDEFMSTVESMRIEFYKPAVRCLRTKIMNGKY